MSAPPTEYGAEIPQAVDLKLPRKRLRGKGWGQVLAAFLAAIERFSCTARAIVARPMRAAGLP